MYQILILLFIGVRLVTLSNLLKRVIGQAEMDAIVHPSSTTQAVTLQKTDYQMK
jgi:hypothetical protein